MICPKRLAKMFLLPFPWKSLFFIVVISGLHDNYGRMGSSQHCVGVKDENVIYIFLKKILSSGCYVMNGSCEKFCDNFRRHVDHMCDMQRADYTALSTQVSQWVSNTTPMKRITESAQYSLAISALVDESDRYLSDDVEWDLMRIDKKVSVWKLNNSSIKLKKEDNEWPCVKSSTIIEIEPEILIEYLMDSSKVKEYNRYSAGRFDIEHISPNSKIVWNTMNIPVGIKPYDFCTLVHRYSRPLQDEIYLVSRSFIHDLVPDNKNYGRSEKIIGLNILRPLRPVGSFKSSTLTEITCISHQRYANTPPIMIEKSMMRGKINYLRKLREVMERST